jgi:hypothetical protein
MKVPKRNDDLERVVVSNTIFTEVTIATTPHKKQKINRKTAHPNPPGSRVHEGRC